MCGTGNKNSQSMKDQIYGDETTIEGFQMQIEGLKKVITDNRKTKTFDKFTIKALRKTIKELEYDLALIKSEANQKPELN